MASRSYGLLRNTKLIADFMEDESNEDEANPTCTKGLTYLVKEKKKAKVKAAPRYQMRLETTDLKSLLVTIDMIWQCNGRLLSSARDPDGRLKDICLSYALYRKIPAEDMEVCLRWATFQRR